MSTSYFCDNCNTLWAFEPANGMCRQCSRPARKVTVARGRSRSPERRGSDTNNTNNSSTRQYRDRRENNQIVRRRRNDSINNRTNYPPPRRNESINDGTNYPPPRRNDSIDDRTNYPQRDSPASVSQQATYSTTNQPQGNWGSLPSLPAPNRDYYMNAPVALAYHPASYHGQNYNAFAYDPYRMPPPPPPPPPPPMPYCPAFDPMYQYVGPRQPHVDPRQQWANPRQHYADPRQQYIDPYAIGIRGPGQHSVYENHGNLNPYRDLAQDLGWGAPLNPHEQVKNYDNIGENQPRRNPMLKDMDRRDIRQEDQRAGDQPRQPDSSSVLPFRPPRGNAAKNDDNPSDTGGNPNPRESQPGSSQHPNQNSQAQQGGLRKAGNGDHFLTTHNGFRYAPAFQNWCLTHHWNHKPTSDCRANNVTLKHDTAFRWQALAGDRWPQIAAEANGVPVTTRRQYLTVLQYHDNLARMSYDDYAESRDEYLFQIKADLTDNEIFSANHLHQWRSFWA